MGVELAAEIAWRYRTGVKKGGKQVCGWVGYLEKQRRWVVVKKNVSTHTNRQYIMLNIYHATKRHTNRQYYYKCLSCHETNNTRTDRPRQPHPAVAPVPAPGLRPSGLAVVAGIRLV